MLLGTDALAQNLSLDPETRNFGIIYIRCHSNKMIETTGVGKFDEMQQAV